eukprot:scaffold3851_cov387-Prasinococcus_capsulatus_cf.AAC.7
MGASGSKLEKALGESLPESEKFFGLENTANLCYCNSVLQALYFCRPFREQMLEYAAAHQQANGDENLLISLAELFAMVGQDGTGAINNQKKKTGVVAPKRFVQTLKNENELFRSFMHQVTPQAATNLIAPPLTTTMCASRRWLFENHCSFVACDDAHEFFNYLLNEIGDLLAKEAVAKDPKLKQGDSLKVKTWMHDIFEGQLTNETRCLRCETVTSRYACRRSVPALGITLPLQAAFATSVRSRLSRGMRDYVRAPCDSCLQKTYAFRGSHSEDKFFCDTCCSLQEAQKRMKLKRPPRVLALHLKRFKFIEQVGRYKKLCYRVVFPHELKLCNTVDGCDDEDTAYHLFAVVVHVGARVDHGHYVCMVKSYDHWISFDDETVEPIEESQLQSFFGSTNDHSGDTEHGYILFYARGPSDDALNMEKASQLVKEHMDAGKRAVE